MNPHSVIQSMQPLSSIKTALDVRELIALRASERDVEACVRSIRDQVFSYQQTAEALMAKVERSPRLCAGVMLLIARRLWYSRVSYELFDTLDTKEFVVESTTYIQHHTSTLLKKLPDYEITEVLEMVEAFEQKLDLHFFIEHYDSVASLDTARRALHDASTQNIIYAAIGIAAVALAALSWVLSPLVTVLWLLIGGGMGAYYHNWQQSIARNVARIHASCSDIMRVQMLARRYKNTAIARQELEAVQRTVQAFFGDMSPNSHLTGIFSIIQMQINV